jgi:hypothetical protein
MSDKPATLADEYDAAIAEGDALLEAPEGVEATEKALMYASDFGVDISKVPGTGAEGKVTVPDVQKFKKEMDAKAEAEEAETESDEEGEPLPLPAKEKPKPKKRPQKSAKAMSDKTALMPTLRTGLKEVYHVVRSIHEFGMGWENQTVSGRDADENIGKMLGEGWVIVHIQALGVDMDGIRMLWVLGSPDEGYEEKFWPYREIQHLTRPIGNTGDDGRGLTGYAANEFISGYLRDGWDLAMVEALGMGTGVINMMWVLVR